MVIDGYKKADCGTFTEDEKAEAYMLASRGFIETEDSKAAEKVNSFVTSKPDKRQMKVFSMWREGIKDKLAEHTKTEVLHGKPVHAFTQSSPTDGSLRDPSDVKSTARTGTPSQERNSSPSRGSDSSDEE